MSEPRQNGFCILPFAPDGAPLGKGFWEFDRLSGRWIDACSAFLLSHGPSFKASWGQELEHIVTTLTSDSGAGLATFYVRGIPALSTLYVSGKNKDTDSEVLEMFIRSMQSTEFARGDSSAFESIRNIAERPLTAAVVWESDALSDDDRDLLRELSTHFAAAMFLANESGE